MSHAAGPGLDTALLSHIYSQYSGYMHRRGIGKYPNSSTAMVCIICIRLWGHHLDSSFV